MGKAGRWGTENLNFKRGESTVRKSKGAYIGDGVKIILPGS